MPLSDREQKILAEIERHFYAEDPALARAVRNIERKQGTDLRIPLLGAIAGLVLIGATFTHNTLLALCGFALLVLSATYLVHTLRARATDTGEDQDDAATNTRTKGRRRFRRA